MTIYDFSVKQTDDREVALSDYQGKVLLVVNTATECGFTPHYTQLQELYDACRDQGLEILDFPCNQFGNQAPGTDAEIHSFCTGRFGVTFPQFAKIDVRGEKADPLFQWISQISQFDGFGMSPMGFAMSTIAKKMDKDYKKNGQIKWNFTKFLFDRQGKLIARFEPTVPMEQVMEKVKDAL